MRVFQFDFDQKKNFGLMVLQRIPTSPERLSELCSDRGEKMPRTDTDGVAFINDKWGVVVAEDIYAAKDILERLKYGYANSVDEKLFFVKDANPANKMVSAY